MILPPVAHDVRVISIAQFTQGNTPVVWRGPMLHRALQQFLADVYWGDLDVLLLDLPPGTGDIAISVAQLIPGAEILVVTTPQTGRRRGRRAGRRDRAADPAAHRRRGGEHVGAADARRLDDAAVRRGRRTPGRRAPDTARRRRRAAAGSGADGSRAGHRGRLRGAAGAVRTRIPPRARSCAASPTRCRPASAGWQACRWASTLPAADGWIPNKSFASR